MRSARRSILRSGPSALPVSVTVQPSRWSNSPTSHSNSVASSLRKSEVHSIRSLRWPSLPSREQHGEEDRNAPESANGTRRECFAATSAQRDSQRSTEHDVNPERDNGSRHRRQSAYRAREGVIEPCASTAPGPERAAVLTISGLALLSARPCAHRGQNMASARSATAGVMVSDRAQLSATLSFSQRPGARCVPRLSSAPPRLKFARRSQQDGPVPSAWIAALLGGTSAPRDRVGSDPGGPFFGAGRLLGPNAIVGLAGLADGRLGRQGRVPAPAQLGRSDCRSSARSAASVCAGVTRVVPRVLRGAARGSRRSFRYRRVSRGVARRGSGGRPRE